LDFSGGEYSYTVDARNFVGKILSKSSTRILLREQGGAIVSVPATVSTYPVAKSPDVEMD
jgi:hypothetical protein